LRQLNRRVCAGNTNCIPICPIQAKYDPSVTINDALATGNVEIRYRTVVSELVLDANGRVASLNYLQYEDASGPRTATGSVQANVFVLAAHAIETPKLLLMSPDPELGYIVPERVGDSALAPVARFIEKPAVPLARTLIADGALWNSFIVAGRAQTLLHVFTQRFPGVVAAMRSVVEQNQCTSQVPDLARELYQHLPDIDFSRHILQEAESALRVLRVAHAAPTATAYAQ
jgi:hypothetical protein